MKIEIISSKRDGREYHVAIVNGMRGFVMNTFTAALTDGEMSDRILTRAFHQIEKAFEAILEIREAIRQNREAWVKFAERLDILSEESFEVWDVSELKDRSALITVNDGVFSQRLYKTEDEIYEPPVDEGSMQP